MLSVWLRRFLVILLLLLNLSYIEKIWTSSKNIGDRGTEALDRWEADMVLVRKALPIKRGVIGYVSEQDLYGAVSGDWDTETEFLLTQYALAPLVLKKGPVAEWNVAVLNYKDLAIWQERHPEYEIINIKGKVRIFHRLDNP